VTIVRPGGTRGGWSFVMVIPGAPNTCWPVRSAPSQHGGFGMGGGSRRLQSSGMVASRMS